jgi:hypothetical protein
MNDFNMAFVGLMGTADIGPINDKPAGLSAADMEKCRQFSLGIRVGPNPNREVDDTIAPGPVTLPGQSFVGRPAVGETLFNDPSSEFDAGQPCTACHANPFGAGGGKLGGVTPEEPTSLDAAALFNGDADQSRHNDLKIPHLRNLYEKIGPVFGDHVSSPPLVRSGFGFSHDGGVPDLGTFLSIAVFTMSTLEAADVATFLRYFPTGTKPAVGQNLTLPPTGPAPPMEGVTPDEQLLAELVGLCDASDNGRHCELVAATTMAGRLRSFRLQGGVWVTDETGESTIDTSTLLSTAEGPITFLGAPLGSGARLGGDRDEDGALNGDDCAPADPETLAEPSTVSGLTVDGKAPSVLTWDAQSGLGASLRHEVVGGDLVDLRASGLVTATACIEGDLLGSTYTDLRADPTPGHGYYYLVRGKNPCGGSFGAGRETIDTLDCSP